MSRDLNLLDPRFRPMVDASLADCAASYIDILVTCTFRSNIDQDALYAFGRTVKSQVGPWTDEQPLGKPVTNAKAGQSAHNFGLGMDIVPIVHGKPDWSGTGPVWEEIANIFQARGCQWLGAPDSPFKEEAHFQHPRWKELAANQEE